MKYMILMFGDQATMMEVKTPEWIRDMIAIHGGAQRGAREGRRARRRQGSWTRARRRPSDSRTAPPSRRTARSPRRRSRSRAIGSSTSRTRLGRSRSPRQVVALHPRAARGASGRGRAARGVHLRPTTNPSQEREGEPIDAEDHTVPLVRRQGRGGRRALRRLFKTRPAGRPRSRRSRTCSRYGEAGPGEPGTAMTVNVHPRGTGVHGAERRPGVRVHGGDLVPRAAASRRTRSTTSGRPYTDGGEESQCGWLKDRYGLSWQIIPDRLHAAARRPRPRPRAARDAGDAPDAEDRHRRAGARRRRRVGRTDRPVTGRRAPDRGPAARARAAGPRRVRPAPRPVRRVRGRRAGGDARRGAAVARGRACPTTRDRGS